MQAFLQITPALDKLLFHPFDLILIHHLLSITPIRRLPTSRTSGTAGRIQDHQSITSRISMTKTYSNKNCIGLTTVLLEDFLQHSAKSTRVLQFRYFITRAMRETSASMSSCVCPTGKNESCTALKNHLRSVHSPEDIHVHQSREIGKHFLILFARIQLSSWTCKTGGSVVDSS